MIDFLGIGAPKCATTWLAACMSDHPQIFMPPEKEVSFFSSIKQWTGDYSDYLNLFKEAKKKQKTGEFSVTYLGAGEICASRIYDFNKKLKLIVVLRDPVKRSYSHYNWLKQLGRVNENTDFFKALEKEPRIITDSFYGKNLKVYLKYFPKQSFLVINFDDIKNNPELVLNKVYKFLDVDPNFKSSMTKDIIGKTIKVKYRFLENIRMKTFKILRKSKNSNLIFYIKKLGISNLYRKINSVKHENDLTIDNYNKIRELFIKDLVLLEDLFDTKL